MSSTRRGEPDLRFVRDGRGHGGRRSPAGADGRRLPGRASGRRYRARSAPDRKATYPDEPMATKATASRTARRRRSLSSSTSTAGTNVTDDTIELLPGMDHGTGRGGRTGDRRHHGGTGEYELRRRAGIGGPTGQLQTDRRSAGRRRRRRRRHETPGVVTASSRRSGERIVAVGVARVADGGLGGITGATAGRSRSGFVAMRSDGDGVGASDRGVDGGGGRGGAGSRGVDRLVVPGRSTVGRWRHQIGRRRRRHCEIDRRLAVTHVEDRPVPEEEGGQCGSGVGADRGRRGGHQGV